MGESASCKHATVTAQCSFGKTYMVYFAYLIMRRMPASSHRMRAQPSLHSFSLGSRMGGRRRSPPHAAHCFGTTPRSAPGAGSGSPSSRLTCQKRAGDYLYHTCCAPISYRPEAPRSSITGGQAGEVTSFSGA